MSEREKAGATEPARAPRFTIVSTVHDVEGYLEDFIASVEAQEFPLEQVQVVIVYDGSTDSCPRILVDWQARRPTLVRIVDADRGLGGARNTGIEHAHGEWVTFLDPGDTIGATYLAEVDAMLEKHPRVAMVATKRVVLEATGQRVPHSLSALFTDTNRVRDLDEHPDFFHGSASAAFFRNELLRRTGLRFDERIRPYFEDGHFCASYLLRAQRPVVAFVTTAEYGSRQRGDDSPMPTGSLSDEGRYTTVLEHGYLDALNQARERYGRVPDWLQSFILCELSWYFSAEEGSGTGLSTTNGETITAMHRLMAKIAHSLEPAVIASFSVCPFRLVWREMLQHSYEETPWHSSYVMVDKLDTAQRLVRVTYRFTGTHPEEEFFSEGNAVRPAFAKTRSINYFGRVMLHERIVWVPSGAVRVRLDGQRADVRLDEPELPHYTLRLWRIRDHLVPTGVGKAEKQGRVRREPTLGVLDRLILRAARTSTVKKYFGKSWVLIDKVDGSNDSAELLFRHLRAKHRNVNAWFTLHKGTPDYRRMRQDGYKRMVPYGSLRWKLLMLNCAHLVSSHADTPIMRPDAMAALVPNPTWRFTFLGHGVTKDDLSGWLNPKDLDLIVTSTPGEHEAVIGEGSPYRYSARETRLTGMPRLDALLSAGKRVTPERRDLLLLAPTWRSWLMIRNEGGGHHVIEPQDFARTEFAQSWMSVIRSPELEALATEHGLEVAVLLHPNLQPLRAALEVPDHVQMLTFEDRDPRDTFARCRALVTDYSSMAFDAAYIERPVVYFQFDRDRMFSGVHSYRKGYFDYRRDGFGPVADTYEEVVRAIIETVESGPHPVGPYAERIRDTFPLRDGDCAERVYQAIEQSTRRVRKQPVP